MVRALLDGSKTQTRRLIKPQPMGNPARIVEGFPGVWLAESKSGKTGIFGVGGITYPYGQPGDRLWVRESWKSFGDSQGVTPPVPHACQVFYMATGSAIWHPVPAGAKGVFEASLKGKPSIHMPRWASRITLEITGIRVERLNNISEADAWAEGVDRQANFCGRVGYKALWESINGPGSWSANPWVFVVEFKKLEGGAA